VVIALGWMRCGWFIRLTSYSYSIDSLARVCVRGINRVGIDTIRLPAARTRRLDSASVEYEYRWTE